MIHNLSSKSIPLLCTICNQSVTGSIVIHPLASLQNIIPICNCALCIIFLLNTTWGWFHAVYKFCQNKSHLHLFLAKYFQGKGFCTYATDDVTGLHTKTQWCFTGTAPKYDGNSLRSKVLHCKGNLFLYIICKHHPTGMVEFNDIQNCV